MRLRVEDDRRRGVARRATVARSNRSRREVGGRSVRGATAATLAATATHEREHHQTQ